ncbi:hypothetical protein CONCODRAFT_13701 [Conidiobolus coronatus NRRL 28638]|uniref:Uncharacterized protein n=1 Tax=Conidiobolus coronatus (strain ATCC 28846 / CBS 209.66 / NRRL 28638) TaxID=796925 RepID=A0A137NQ90_CONC2|nr:hypothetical protein CONCODRAFT_13701 [Conidiobolus coronatus NRRL 28638]|eukprot:KXN64911.1 hypothetical protein CONCODRAFT_13701 [Conidiobolus coronatus NRRL 28638]
MDAEFILRYNTCVLCSEQITKPRQICCKKCLVNSNSNKVSNCRVFKMKLNKYTNTFTEALNVTHNYLEYKTSSNSLSDNRGIIHSQYAHKRGIISSYEWTNLQKIDQLSDFIINSNKVDIMEFLFKWHNDLKNVPRIQILISENADICKRAHNTSIIDYNSIIARPLLMVLQDKFWKGLIESYIRYFHPKCMLFSLANFDIKTASEALLSAIHFAGFIVQPNPLDEIIHYMKTYAMCNIKKILFTMRLSSVQALGIYSYAFF